MNLLIIGAPGTGKGTMSNLIVGNYNVVHISTGDMLRASINENTEVGHKAQSYMVKGQLVPDDIINEIIVERLQHDDIEQGFLMDGYPRTYSQAVSLSEILKKFNKKIDCVIDLELDEEVLKNRITGRRVCGTCKEIYHIESKPSKIEGICDVCGGTLVTRKDDTLESLEVRLGEYHKNTKPVIEYYKNLDLVKEVNADQKPEKVFSDIQEILGGLK